MSDIPQLNTVVLGTSGPPLIMLHGWGQTLESLRPLGELLAWKHQVHLIDLPGFGKSTAPPEPWGTLDYSKRILNYLDEKGLKQVDIVGHSLGGRISIRLAANNPDRVRDVILISSHGLKLPPSIDRRIKQFFIRNLRTLVKVIDRTLGSNLFAKKFIPKFGSRDYLAAGALRPTLVKVVNEDLAGEAKRIKARTLLLWGEKDQETPVAMGKRYNQLISGSKLFILPNKDHFPFTDSGAHLCAHFILPFLEAQSVPV